MDFTRKSLFGQKCEINFHAAPKNILMRLMMNGFFPLTDRRFDDEHNQDFFTRASSNFIKTNLHKHYARLFQC